MRTPNATPKSFSAASLCLAVLFACTFLVACADEAIEETAEEPVEALEGAPADVAGDMARVEVAEQAPYGSYLVDSDGHALYLFTSDTQGEGSSTCYDACAEAWPPLLTTGDPAAAAPAVDASMLGTIERQDGSMQVTYNGWPLYYFQQDAGPGDVAGQDIHGFGGEWYLVSPQGQQIEAEEGGAS